ncbi:MAG: HD domain-containing phosphohydrolase [Gluconacetobacter sp.]
MVREFASPVLRRSSAPGARQGSTNDSLAQAFDVIEPGHGLRVGVMAAWLAEAGGFGIDAEVMRQAGALHDVGKLLLPPILWSARRRLTSSELALIRQHPALGVGLIRASRETVHPRVLEAVFFHHEWHDGSGYPIGLAGGAIPLSARLIGIADVVDALLSVRAYKRAWSPAEVRAHLRSLSGRQFAPDLADLADVTFGGLLEVREDAR